ncbi:ribosome small subunit-dependent GTPase A [Luminiphilus syltensis NOR5-1B]|uniref:Small ribosomal subunit biogenesis GTPase RsgA n=1 Tax=Luminiphilus syltensis NOR5-1B TaxID=565045 RepID=B8KW57_9GAMM|nr:small ribosomal subunit biogenesis GTPase RsgA [Luminiphilus syltensis]EED34814.1 ribosome small subunit-dependent GTPase A [Luminiphilus syltensis NOR5-1B]
MSKRRLSKQQQRRIAERHREARSASLDDAETMQPGVVIARYGKQVLLEDESGTRRTCPIRPNVEDLVAGDRVAWLQEQDTPVVVARQPRRSALSRPDARGRPRTVAANVDLMLIVIAPEPEPHANLIDRYLVAAEDAGIDTALVLNKADLIDDNNPLLALMDRYRALDYPCVVTGRQEPDAQQLEALIDGRTLVLVGQSGVGKSSLVQRLLPDIDIRVGELSAAIAKGRHTTTTAALYHLPSGGHLIDSPGIREFHLHHLPADAVAPAFPDFRPFLGHCRFRDCQHSKETGCAILEAVEAGRIAPERLDSYRAIISSLEA